MMVDEGKRTEGSGKRRLLQVDGALGQSLAGPEEQSTVQGCPKSYQHGSLFRLLQEKKEKVGRMGGWEVRRWGEVR